MTSSPEEQQTFSFVEDVVLQVIGDEAVILKLQEEVVFSLNETGARIAQLIAAGHPLGIVIELLSREYGISRDDMAREVKGLVDVLRSRRLVVIGSGQ